MERDEFDKIVNLAKAAYASTLKAKADYAAYVSAATEAYAAQARQAAQGAYEKCMGSPNFEEAFIKTLNQTFKTDFADSSVASSAISPASAAASTPIAELEPELTTASKPAQDLFSNPEQEFFQQQNEEKRGWQ